MPRPKAGALNHSSLGPYQTHKVRGDAGYSIAPSESSLPFHRTASSYSMLVGRRNPSAAPVIALLQASALLTRELDDLPRIGIDTIQVRFVPSYLVM